MLDSKTLNKFIHNFLGYGNLNSEFYFIGMEEGGGSSEEEISQRLVAWVEAGENTLVDLVEYSRKIGAKKFFTEKPVSQSTWSKLIKMMLSSEGDFSAKLTIVKSFQRTLLGRPDSNNALIELMPLPSQGIDKWIYRDITDDPRLDSRERYLKEIAPLRVERIKKMIEEHKPKFVVFYSYTYLDYWQSISGVSMTELGANEIYYGKSDDTHFIVTKHPVSFIRKGYFEDVGKFIKSIGRIRS